MSEKAKVGTTVLKNRNIQRLWFILVVVILAAIIGVYLGAAVNFTILPCFNLESMIDFKNDNYDSYGCR